MSQANKELAYKTGDQQLLCICVFLSSCQTTKSIPQFELHAVWLQATICGRRLQSEQASGRDARMDALLPLVT